MSDEGRVDLIDFYKQLVLKEQIEKERYEIYLEEQRTYVTERDQEKILINKIKLEQQASFLETLRIKQKEIVTFLNNYYKTFNDIEAYVFSQCIIGGRTSLAVSKELEYSHDYIRKIKSDLTREINSHLVVNKI